MNIPAPQTALHETVLAVLAKYDPEGMLGVGAPADEYDPEARDLTNRIQAGVPVTEDTLCQVWAA